MYVYRRRFFAVAQLVLDGLSLWPIWALAVQVRILLDPLTTRQLTAEEAPGWVAPLLPILILSLLVWIRLKLYVIPQDIGLLSLLRWSGENTLAVLAVTVLTTFFPHRLGGGASRIFVLCLIPVTFLVFIATRCFVLAVMELVQRRSPQPRIALIGDSSDVKRLVVHMETRVRSAIRGMILPEGTAGGLQSDQIPVLGTTAQIAELVNRERLDSVIVVNGACSEAELERCNTVFRRMGLPVSWTLSLGPELGAPAFSWASSSRIELSRLNGLRVVDMRSARFTRARDIVKRALDLSVSLLLLILTAPVMLVIALIVKLTSPGPVFEKAPRVGKGGRHFMCLKFRTTYEDLNQPAPPREWNVNEADDVDEHHVTPFGERLRLSSLDELPQLINVLTGHMSLVGPRPLPAHRLGPDGMSTEFADWSEKRALVCPGLTGLWQVGGRGLLSFDEMIDLDLEYIKNRSLLLDLRILLKTPVAVIRGLGER